MSKIQGQKSPAAIERIRAELDAWRGRKRRAERIPEPLWSAAVRVAREHGVSSVSRALGVEYSQLKRRVGEARKSGHELESVEAVFVEMVGGRSEPGAGCVVELEKGNGTRMRICVRDGAAVDWGQMKEAFLRA